MSIDVCQYRCLRLLACEAVTHTRHAPLAPDRRAVDLLAAIRAGGWEDKTLLAPHDDVPVLHYYFPRARLRGYADRAAIPVELAARGCGRGHRWQSAPGSRSSTT